MSQNSKPLDIFKHLVSQRKAILVKLANGWAIPELENYMLRLAVKKVIFLYPLENGTRRISIAVSYDESNLSEEEKALISALREFLPHF